MSRSTVVSQRVDFDQLVGRVGHVGALAILNHPSPQAPVLGLFPTLHRFSQHPGLGLGLSLKAAVTRHPGQVVGGAHSDTSISQRQKRNSTPGSWWGCCRWLAFVPTPPLPKIPDVRLFVGTRLLYSLDAALSRPQTAERGEEIQRRKYGRIRRSELDYLLLEVFGSRYLPDEVARRIALRGELPRGFAGAFDRHPDLGSSEPSPLEALSAVG